MAYQIDEIEGIGPAYAEKLKAENINTVESFLEKCSSKSGRSGLADSTGIDEGRILTWANMADLMRIKGVGGEFAELLVASGVDTIKELRTRNADNLHVKMEETHAEKKLTRRVPSLDQVKDFVEQAKDLEPTITH